MCTGECKLLCFTVLNTLFAWPLHIYCMYGIPCRLRSHFALWSEIIGQTTHQIKTFSSFMQRTLCSFPLSDCVCDCDIAKYGYHGFLFYYSTIGNIKGNLTLLSQSQLQSLSLNRSLHSIDFISHLEYIAMVILWDINAFSIIAAQQWNLFFLILFGVLKEIVLFRGGAGGWADVSMRLGDPIRPLTPHLLQPTVLTGA